MSKPNCFIQIGPLINVVLFHVLKNEAFAADPLPLAAGGLRPSGVRTHARVVDRRPLSPLFCLLTAEKIRADGVEAALVAPRPSALWGY